MMTIFHQNICNGFLTQQPESVSMGTHLLRQMLRRLPLLLNPILTAVSKNIKICNNLQNTILKKIKQNIYIGFIVDELSENLLHNNEMMMDGQPMKYPVLHSFSSCLTFCELF